MLKMKDDSGNKYKQADAEMTRIYKLARETCDDAGKERLKKELCCI